jgi:hypothetical protein
MLEHSSVQGARAYPDRNLAWYRARSLIRPLVELRVHERWQLAEHVSRGPQGKGY